MSTLDRLKRLTGEAKVEPTSADRKRQELSELRRRIERILERRPERAEGRPLSGTGPAGRAPTAHQPPPRPPAAGEPEPVTFTPLELEAVAEGEEVTTPHGRVFVAMNEVDAGSFWGRHRLREIDHLDMRAVATLAHDPRLADLSPADALFLDTETTGLAGGTGTLAFLIGLGWIEDGRFVTRLIFARDFTEEPAALSLLARFAAGKKFLVSFNGKSFDVGILAARYVLNRLSDPLGHFPHLDLLHSSRRLLGHRLENSRLATLEQEVLGFGREGDVPGAEIPERYFQYLRTHDARFIAKILEHNRLDVVSMAALTIHLAELVRSGRETLDANPADVVAAARLHLARGQAAHAERLLRGLLDEHEAHAFGECGRELSLIWKRAERWDEAVVLWRRRLEADPFDLFAIEEMAKWLEHRARRFAEAIELVERGLAAADLGRSELREAFAHRLARLRRKSGDAPF